jgi:3-deoxy-D-manno-octulosonate 8-phosphate phosphatase, yrbI family
METSNSHLKQKASKILYFFTDIDGTLTDGGVYYSSGGEQLKKFNLRDGTGFFLLRKANIKSGFITTENSPIVARRAEKLKVDEYIYGTERKVEAINLFLEVAGLDFENIAYIGDEINDVSLLGKVGLSFAVGDAIDLVKSISDIVCTKKGGQGAFREAVEILMELRGVNVEDIIDHHLS